MLRGDEDSELIREGLRIGVEGIVSVPVEKPKAPANQGWVMIDGRKYTVMGDALVPG
jgi:hypothetical protein